MSGTFGIGNRARCELTMPNLEKALCTAARRAESSPVAVAIVQMRGCRPDRARSVARWNNGPGRTF